MDNERPGAMGAGSSGMEDAGDGDIGNIIRETAFVFEQLEIGIRATKERAAVLALNYRGLDPLVLSARIVELAEAVAAVGQSSGLTVHHLRNVASEVLAGG